MWEVKLLFFLQWVLLYHGCMPLQAGPNERGNWYGQGCPPHATGQFPYVEDCKKFYNCFKGRGQLSICAPGTLFNPATLECDFPEKVSCVKGRGFHNSRLTQDSSFQHSHQHQHIHQSSQNPSAAGHYTHGSNNQLSEHSHHTHHYHKWHHDHSPGFSTYTRPLQKGHYITNSKAPEVSPATYHSGVQPPGTLIAVPARELLPPQHSSLPNAHSSVQPKPAQHPYQPQASGYPYQPQLQQPVHNPSQLQPGQYPSQQQPGQYSTQQQPGQYPTQQQPGQYPTQQQPGQYPTQQQPGQYPTQQQPGQYPTQQQPGQYSTQQQPVPYPSQSQPQQPPKYPSSHSLSPSQDPHQLLPQPQQSSHGYYIPTIQQPLQPTGDSHFSSVSQQSSSQSSHGYSIPLAQPFPPYIGSGYYPQISSKPSGPQQELSSNGQTLSENERIDFEKKFKTIVPQPSVVYDSYGVPVGSGVRFPSSSTSSGSDAYYPPPGSSNFNLNEQSGYGSSYGPNIPSSGTIPSVHENEDDYKGGHSSSRDSDSGFSSNSNNYDIKTSVENPNPVYTQVKSQNKNNVNNICPSGYQGLLPHSDCTKFLSCANGRTFVMDCGPGTRFHPNLYNCVHAHEVECGSSHGLNQDLDTESTQNRGSAVKPDKPEEKDYEFTATEEPGQHEVPEEPGQHEVPEEPGQYEISEDSRPQKVPEYPGHADKIPSEEHVLRETTTEENTDPDVSYVKLKQPTLTLSVSKGTQDESISNTKNVFRPESITDPRPIEHIPKSISKRNSTSDRQVLRLRGSPTQFEGFVEMQLSPGSWGIVCDKPRKWRSEEAHIVCKTLGFPRGAELTWQGLPAEVSNTTSEILAADEVVCTGDEESILDCTLNVGSGCKPEKDGIWVRCYGHGQSRCHPGEMSLGDKCYSIVVPTEDVPTEHLVGFTQGEALAHCQKNGGHLLDITSQLENDFVSEWLLRQNIDGNIMTSGVGMSLMGGTIWIWEGSETTFNYHNWWPGWSGVKSIPPQVGSRAQCIVMKRHFPCQDTNYGEDKLCDAQYYFWDLEDCDSLSTMLPYVCERPANNIGCVVGSGTSYKGAANVTQTGKTCLEWDSKEVLPELKYKISESDRKMALSGHNYCRNVAGKETHPWCYVKAGKEIVKDLCDIPICSKAIEKSARYFQCPPNHFSCGTNGECISSDKVCDGNFDCSNSNDEVGCTKQKNEEEAIMLEFEFYEHKKLSVLEIEVFVQTGLLECAKKCIERVNCRSFSYLPAQSQCLLSESNIGLSGALISEADWNYYELKSKSLNCMHSHVCANGKCIANETVCNGINNCGDNSDEKDCSWLKQNIQIRLTGGSKPSEGAVEVKVKDSWGLVCDDEFDMKDGDVICRHLGFPLGVLEIKKHSYFKSNHTSSFLIDNLSCKGNESSLADCHHNGWGIHDCRDEEYNSIDYMKCSNKAAGVICKVTKTDCKFNYWQCETSTECIPLAYLCDNVKDCADNSDEDPIKCDSSVELRLVGIGGESRSNKVTEGRVEVKRFGVWGTVCDDDFGPREAEVVCNSLGFKGIAQAYKEAAYGAGQGVIWLDQVHCFGNETNISECMSDGWGQTNCRHNEDVAVSCSPQKLNMPTKGVTKKGQEEIDQNIDIDLDDIFNADCGTVMDNIDIVQSDFSARVVSGFETVKGTYPWQGSVRVKSVSGKSSHWCGAAVVSRYHVITAGHCLRDYIKAAYFIRVGDYDNEVDEGTEQDLEIDELWIHPDLDKKTKLNNDIAVVKVKNPGFEFNSWVTPACLPKTKDEHIPKNCTISGWGSNSNPGTGFARILHATWLQPLPSKTCKSPSIYGDSLTEGMFCAGSLKGGPDSCQGDSGGPFLCPVEGHLTLFGITSWGHGCGRSNSPGVYTKVPLYLDWINEKIKLSMINHKYT